MAKEKKDAAAADAPPAGKISFHLAILQPDGMFVTQECDTKEEMVERLKSLINQDVTVFAFRGERLKISKPPMRHLLVPGEEPVPLFDLPTEFEEDDTGYLGVDPINMEDPPQLRVSSKGGRTPSTSDPFTDDADDGGLNAFDDILPDPDS
jgi:hypothetical protein